MRGIRTIVALALAAATVTAGVLIVGNTHYHRLPAIGQERDTPDGADEEQARAEWELMRQRDPVTGRIPEGIKRREQEFAATLPGAAAGGLAKAASGSGIEWSSRGPYNVGGRTRALAVDVSDPATILAGGVSGGMWRSTDGGASWARTTLPAQLPAVSCVVQDTRPGKTNIWYYGTGERVGNSAQADHEGYFGDGVFKSTDGGASWSQLASTVSGTPQIFDSAFDYVWRLAVNTANSSEDEVFAAASGAIMRSLDGGRSWRRVLGEVQSARYSDVAVTSDGVVYATLGGDSGAARGVWRSVDGVNWTTIAPPTWPANAHRIVIGIAPSNPSTVYFLGETPGFGRMVPGSRGEEWSSLWRYHYVSGNGAGSGGSWEDRSNNLPEGDGGFAGFRSQGSYDLTIGVEPDNENIVVIGGTNLYRSVDGFATLRSAQWIGGYAADGSGSAHYSNHHPDQHAIAFSPTNPKVLYSANDGGVQRTDDLKSLDVTWTSLDKGYVTAQFYSLAIDDGLEGDNTLIGGLQDNGTWMTTSKSSTDLWTNISGADGGYCAIGNLSDGRRYVYLATQQGPVYGAEVGVNNEILSVTRVDPAAAEGFLFVVPWALDPSNNDVMYLAAGNSIWRNSELSTIPPAFEPTEVNWTVMTTSDTGVYTAIGISRRNPANRVYVGNQLGQIQRFDQSGQTHQPAVSPLPSLQGYINCIAVDPDNGDRAIAVFSNYSVISLFSTTDGGDTWTPVSGNLEEHPDGSGNGPSCRWAQVVHRPNGDIYFVGTSMGLYSTRALNGMATVWTQEGAGTIGNVVVNMIAVRQSDGTIAVATHGNGMFSATIGELAGVGETVAATTAGSTLDGPYPNPVRERAAMRYTVAGSGAAPVRLGVFDLSGHEIIRLVDRVQPAGEYSADLIIAGSESPRPSGRYYCRLEVGGRVVAVRAVNIMR